MNCSRCNQPVPIDYDAMLNVETGFTTVDDFEKPTSPPSGEDMPLVIPPPAGWLADPDDEDRFICRGCATEAELDELSLLELRVAGVASEDDLADLDGLHPTAQDDGDAAA